jgi:hypothetical protein
MNIFFGDEMSPIAVSFWSARFSSGWQGTSHQYSDSDSGVADEAKKNLSLS